MLKLRGFYTQPRKLMNPMGFRIKLAPGVRIRISSRGVRTSVGPRIGRVHVGGGRAGMSTGVGPFSAYSSFRGSPHHKAVSKNSGSLPAAGPFVAFVGVLLGVLWLSNHPMVFHICLGIFLSIGLLTAFVVYGRKRKAREQAEKLRLYKASEQAEKLRLFKAHEAREQAERRTISMRLDDIENLSDPEFTGYILKIFRAQGFFVTVSGGHQGRALILTGTDSDRRRVMIKCLPRSHHHEVGVAAVQDALGKGRSARGVDRFILLTPARFANAAKRFSEIHSIELIDGKKLVELAGAVRTDAEEPTPHRAEGTYHDGKP